MAETRFTVEDGRCGNCHCLLVEHQSNGAQYAVDKRLISESHTIILAQWLSSEYARKWAAYGQPLIHSTKNVKSDPHNTTAAPKYRLNMGRVCTVMNNKGMLA